MSRRSSAPVARYLALVRARLFLVLAARALLAGTGAFASVFAAGAYSAGPLASPITAALVWVLAVLAALAAITWALAPARALAGPALAALLREARSELVSPVRSAIELARDASGASRSLIEAHARKVSAELARTPPSRVVPLGSIRHRASVLGVAAGAAALALFSLSDHASAGAWALLHPGQRGEDGAPIAALFVDVRARLTFPTYLSREPISLLDPTLIEAPAGTTLEISARPRLPSTAGEVVFQGRALAMERRGDHWFARLLVRADGELLLRARGPEGTWIRDAVVRSVRIQVDQAPRVELLYPAEDVIVEPGEVVPLGYDASDDVGVATVEWVLRSADGRERRRRIATPEMPRPALQGREVLTADLLAGAPGDRFELWIEARDADDVTGPNLGRSATRAITLASEATRRAEDLEALERLLDRAIAALADRLETPPPADDAGARARMTLLTDSTRALIDRLEARTEGETGPAAASDRVLPREAGRRLRQLLADERRLHGSAIAPLPARERIDERAIAELEDVVMLALDLLTRAQIDDAAAITRELESLRQEIASLLGELRRAETPEARQAVLAAIARAQQRLKELRARMGRMHTAVPEEFANRQEREAQAAADALGSLREAIERGDLDAAARALTRLEQQIDQLARALGDTGESTGEERFGPRERALADALDRLMSLEAEQRELARRSNEVRGAAARRALEAAGEASSEEARRLARQAREVRQVLEQIEEERLSMIEREAFDSAQQRLSDAEDSLEAGDLGEAARMTEVAAEQLETLRRDLELDALMFPGERGETGRSARAANEAERRLAQLEEGIERALPDLGEHVLPGERGQMQGDATRQRSARSATDGLAESFERGPDGAPLVDDVGPALREIGELMERGEGGLARGAPSEASRAQEDAAQRLTALREQIEQDLQRSGGGGGGGGEDGSTGMDFRRPVRIHDADEFSGPMELRRRVLDAMHEAPPQGYEESVRRYYEGLLR